MEFEKGNVQCQSLNFAIFGSIRTVVKKLIQTELKNIKSVNEP